MLKQGCSYTALAPFNLAGWPLNALEAVSRFVSSSMKIIYPPYVLKRMIERNITVAEVRDVLENGELIEEYQADSPPRYLMLGWGGSRPIHIVGEDDPVTDETTVVTAYEPDAKRWKAGFRERRR